jgi:hypothetical protein
MMYNNHFAFGSGSRVFLVASISSRVVVDSLAAAAGARCAVVVRHLCRWEDVVLVDYGRQVV